MRKGFPAVTAGLLLLALAACSISQPRLDHPDQPPIMLGSPIKPELQAEYIHFALDQRHWQAVADAPGHIVATLTSKAHNLSIRMEITYGGSEVRMKLLELAGLDGRALTQSQIDHYWSYTGALRYSMVGSLNEAMLASAPRAD